MLTAFANRGGGGQTVHATIVKPVTNNHPLGPEKAVFSGRWSLVRGLHRTTIII